MRSTKGAYGSALITGATSGIGAAFAEVLPPTTRLFLTGRNPERLAEASARLRRESRELTTMAADLADAAAVDALAECANAYGIDLLINNAGLGMVGRFLDHSLDAERRTVMVNAVATVALTRLLLPGMLSRARASGRRAGLIIVASSTAFTPVPYFATYAASKAFDLHFAEAIAEELRDEPVDVVALCPGATRTAFGARAGFTLGDLPGAADPRHIARQGLAALGRDRICLTGLVGQAALGPLALRHRLAAGALGAVMRLITPQRG